jgi:hypothetical protein
MSFGSLAFGWYSDTTITQTATTIAIFAGNNQSAPGGHPVARLPTVIVRDQNGNPMVGVVVTFAVVSGGGTATGLTPTTDSNGLASVGSWTLGVVPGANTLSATLAGVSGSPLTFTATSGLGLTQRARWRHMGA